jgi:hypothetical protein
VPPPPESTIHRSQVVALLAASLGEEKSGALWDETVHRLSIPPGEWFTQNQVAAVLGALSSSSDLVGVAARYARVRFENASLAPPSAPSSHRRQPTSSSPPASVSDDLMSLLAPSLGEDKAREAILHTSRALHLSSAGLTRDDALAILEEMAKAPGLLGVAARLGTARFLLRYPAV